MKKLTLLLFGIFLLGSGCVVDTPIDSISLPQDYQESEIHLELDNGTLNNFEETVDEVGYEIQGSALEKAVVETDKVIVPAQKDPKPVSTSPSYAPNGTYTNVDGNEVARPYAAPSKPSGASAKCKDGTYSFSQNRRGTCSGHGGVSRWY